MARKLLKKAKSPVTKIKVKAMNVSKKHEEEKSVHHKVEAKHEPAKHHKPEPTQLPAENHHVNLLKEALDALAGLVAIEEKCMIQIDGEGTQEAAIATTKLCVVQLAACVEALRDIGSQGEPKVISKQIVEIESELAKLRA